MRLIDADRFKNWLMENYILYDGNRSLKDIDEQPTVDAVPVVRCKDCKWKQGSECVRFSDLRPFPDDYCSRGEKEWPDERMNS